MIGKSVPRVDAYEKVTGRAKFTDDLILNKCLVARVYPLIPAKQRLWTA